MTYLLLILVLLLIHVIFVFSKIIINNDDEHLQLKEFKRSIINDIDDIDDDSTSKDDKDAKIITYNKIMTETKIITDNYVKQQHAHDLKKEAKLEKLRNKLEKYHPSIKIQEDNKEPTFAPTEESFLGQQFWPHINCFDYSCIIIIHASDSSIINLEEVELW